MTLRAFLFSFAAGLLFLGTALAQEGNITSEPDTASQPFMPPLPAGPAETDAPAAAMNPAPVSGSAAPVVRGPSAPEPASFGNGSTHLDPHIAVTKIHEVRNDVNRHEIQENVETDFHPLRNDALEFEREYWNYGAVTQAQKEARRGQIYVISWRNKAAPGDFTVRFEYRQQNSHDLVKVKTMDYHDAHGNVRSIFKVVGDEYHQDGPVEGWCLSILRDGQVVGQEKSFIW